MLIWGANSLHLGKYCTRFSELEQNLANHKAFTHDLPKSIGSCPLNAQMQGNSHHFGQIKVFQHLFGHIIREYEAFQLLFGHSALFLGHQTGYGLSVRAFGPYYQARIHTCIAKDHGPAHPSGLRSSPSVKGHAPRFKASFSAHPGRGSRPIFLSAGQKASLFTPRNLPL